MWWGGGGGRAETPFFILSAVVYIVMLWLFTCHATSFHISSETLLKLMAALLHLAGTSFFLFSLQYEITVSYGIDLFPPPPPPHQQLGGILKPLSICPCVRALSRRYLLDPFTFCNKMWYGGAPSRGRVWCQKKKSGGGGGGLLSSRWRLLWKLTLTLSKYDYSNWRLSFELIILLQPNVV